MRYFALGAATAFIAAVVTAIYLASITIDDGLEGLLFVPVLAAAAAVVGAVSGWRSGDAEQPIHAGLGVGAAVLLGGVAMAAWRRELLAARAAVSVAFLATGVAMVAGLLAWQIGSSVARLRR